MTTRYHAFYVNLHGHVPHYEVYDNENDILELVKKAKDHSDAEYTAACYANFLVIYGDVLEFEPCEVVQSWRVKEEV